MVEPLARGETVRVTIGGAGERSACRKRGQAVLGTEGIEIESERRRCEKDANARKGNRDENASHYRTRIALRHVRRRSTKPGRALFSLYSDVIAAAVSTSTHRRCNRRRHDGCL